MAELQISLGDNESAARYWEESVRLAPQSIKGRFAMILIALQQGDYERMAALSREALALAPESADLRNFLGHALIELGRLEEALAVLEENVQGDSASGETFALLGKTCLLRKDYEQAAAYYEQAVDVAPAWSKAHYGLGNAHARMGNQEKAKKCFADFRRTRAREIASEPVPTRIQDPTIVRRDVASFYRQSAEVLSEHGDSRKAQSYWLRAAILDPSDASARPALIRRHQKQGRTAAANSMSQRPQP